MSHCLSAQRRRCATFHADARAAAKRLDLARAGATEGDMTLELVHQNGMSCLDVRAPGGVVTSDATRLRHVARLPVVMQTDARDGYCPSSAAGAHSVEWPSMRPWRGCNSAPPAARAVRARREALALREEFRTIEAERWDGFASIAELCVQVGHLTEAVYARRRVRPIAAVHEPGRRLFEISDELADCLLHAMLLTVVLEWDDRVFAARMETASSASPGDGDATERAAVLAVVSAQLQECGLRIHGMRVGIDRRDRFDSERAFLDDRLEVFLGGLFAFAAGEALDVFAAFDAMLADARQSLSSGITHDNQRSSLRELRARFLQPIRA